MHKIIPVCRNVEVKPNQNVTMIRRLDFRDSFVPTWFHIPDESAKNFLITCISLDHNNQLCSTGAVPAELFAESLEKDLTLTKVGVKFNEMTCGSVLRFSVLNISKEPQFFTSDVRGYYKEDLPPGMKYHHILGFGHTPVRPLGSCNILVQPQLDCEPKLLFVPPHLRGVFHMISLFSDVADSNHLSGEAFNDVELKPYPIVPRSTFLTLVCQNRTDIQQNMNAAVLCLPVPPKETINK
jgi:hypothetical protein